MPVAGLFLAKLPLFEILYLSLGKKRIFPVKNIFFSSGRKKSLEPVLLKKKSMKTKN